MVGAFFSGAWAKIVAILAVFGLIGLAFVRIFLAGKAAERVAQMQKTLKSVGEAKKVDDQIRAKTDDELDDQLRRQRERLK